MNPRTLLCGLIVSASISVASTAQLSPAPSAPPATQPAPAGTTSGGPTPVSVLAGRPDADAPTELLGQRFESQAAGIGFRPPAKCREIRRAGSDQIVEYLDDGRSWVLRVTRPSFPKPWPLETVEQANNQPPIIGLLDYTVDQLKSATPGAQVVRQEVINVGPNFVGLILMRYTLGQQRWLRQHALFQVNDQQYFIFNFTTPVGEPDPDADKKKPEDIKHDPQEQIAVDTFNAMIDSIKLIDRTPIKNDQNNRLYRTRTLFLSWSEKKYTDILVPRQYFRIIQSGQDVGYTYVEEALESQDMSGVGIKGVSAYARSHTEGKDEHGQLQVIDVGTFRFNAFDRRHETWTRSVVVQSQNEKGAQETHTSEFGSSRWETRKMLTDSKIGVHSDPKDDKSPLVRPYDWHVLDVSIMAKNGTPEPVHFDLGPMYLPQAAEHFLPRLVVDKAFREPRTYLFASYVGDAREMMLRYVDVSDEQEVQFNGKKVRAVTVSERLGLEGVPTIHYVTPEGQFLGSESRELKLVVLPADEATIRGIWHEKANLTRPEPVKRQDAPAGSALDRAAPGRGLPPAIQ